MSVGTAGRTTHRGLRMTFRIVAGIFGLFALVFSVPFAIGSFVDEAEDIHLIHNLSGAAVYGAILGVGSLALAARPEGSVATFQGLALAAVGALIGGILAGDVVEGLWFAPAVMILVLFALYPDRASFLRFGRLRPGSLVLVAAAAIPLIAYALTQARLQSEGVLSDPHVEFHHYGGMAAGSLMLLLFAIAPGLGALGWRLAAWLAGIAMAIIAIGSIAYGDHASALGGIWAWLGLAWAVAYVALAEFDERRASRVVA